MAGNEKGGEDDDYMGDLSLFLPPQASTASSAASKKKPLVKIQAPEMPKPKPKIPKGLNWQERRKLEREQMQREEDERTLAGIESAIPESNIGFKMLKNMGYNPGSALGKDGIGRLDPVGLDIRRSREGIGAREEAKRTERVQEEKKRRNDEGLTEEFGMRKKSQWRSKRVMWDFKKAEAALAQLENREIVEREKNEDEEKVEEEEEEEEITEEDLNNILMKLRDEHRYCLYCGCQYESMEALETSCPGLYEDDH